MMFSTMSKKISPCYSNAMRINDIDLSSLELTQCMIMPALLIQSLYVPILYNGVPGMISFTYRGEPVTKDYL